MADEFTCIGKDSEQWGREQQLKWHRQPHVALGDGAPLASMA
eukprot:CAMPEP_0115286830 /NCGR_PEP_ID=MMETSP0270-20121206/62139_1 /TAXON_ID=71861 /ORGANISM="Scrippsiella trochoidea, Strain CCMP3099" /LENGTH=41 /DNA_ID= /DNA_START= /DNA_END= /DNA_ORIENTATION=